MVSFFLTVALPCVYVYYTYLTADGERRQAAAEEQIFGGRMPNGLELSGAARLHRTSNRAEAASAPARACVISDSRCHNSLIVSTCRARSPHGLHRRHRSRPVNPLPRIPGRIRQPGEPGP